ncbi:uncharacterized protein EDB91DRAFT_1087334 [Suillus paluster]|uniref:uncharacterized protein n=1 Tax=Suillus paluster TaxID=48578 RepID=UPI001B878526|nr:uncharacterized protein EDB91DRAFT_1087334 [Suillus paluster]KAG1724814.1 hypothetical protein EDB91DRAFT_1087334 [Suillus paluster]
MLLTRSKCRAYVTVQSNEIAKASLHIALPWYTHLYTIPFLLLYLLLVYAYYIKYDDWLKSEEWTSLACVSLGAQRESLENNTKVPADILLVQGTCIVDNAMLSGESTPLLKESIQLLDSKDKLDVDSAHKNAVLFSGTKVLQASPTDQGQVTAATLDRGCLGLVLRIGFGTAQGQLME